MIGAMGRILSRQGRQGERVQRAGLVGAAVGSVALLATLLAGGEGGALLFGALAVAVPVAPMALGGPFRRRGFGLVLAGLAVLLQGGFWGLLALRGQLLEGPWVACVPLAVVVFLGAFWLLPLGAISVAHGLFFETPEETEGTLERLRSLRIDLADRADRAGRQDRADREDGEAP